MKEWAPGLGLAEMASTWLSESSWSREGVSERLSRAGFLCLQFEGGEEDALARSVGGESGARGGQIVDWARGMCLWTQARAQGAPQGECRLGPAIAEVGLTWSFLPEDGLGCRTTGRENVAPFDEGTQERIEVREFIARFNDGASGFRAFGMGRVLPKPHAADNSWEIGAVLEVLGGWGLLADLKGTVVLFGDVDKKGSRLQALVRFQGTSKEAWPESPERCFREESPSDFGFRCLVLVGEVDPKRPVTLRLSPCRGILGSNVFEKLRVASVRGDSVPEHARVGADVGSLSARLSFDPLTLGRISPIQTRRGVFTLTDRGGQVRGAIYSDMVEGRGFRTWLSGVGPPVYRFAGFGPIAGGSGEFVGVKGTMIMNSIVSVQPRTLSNLYVLKLDT